MRKLQIIALTILAIGVLFKLLYWPGASLSLLLGTGLYALSALLFVIKNGRGKWRQSLFSLAIAMFLLHLMIRMQFYQGAFLFFILTAVLGNIWLLVYLKSGGRDKIKIGLVVFCLLASVGLDTITSYELHYWFYVKGISSESVCERNFRAWDKQSWFYYQCQLFEEAMDAHRKAVKAMDLVKSEGGSIDPEEEVLIHETGLWIKNRTWTSYYPQKN